MKHDLALAYAMKRRQRTGAARKPVQAVDAMEPGLEPVPAMEEPEELAPEQSRVGAIISRLKRGLRSSAPSED